MNTDGAHDAETGDGSYHWKALGNGTLIHVRHEGRAGLMIGAVWPLEDGRWEAALSQHGSGFWSEGEHDDQDDAIDHVLEKIEWFNRDPDQDESPAEDVPDNDFGRVVPSRESGEYRDYIFQRLADNEW